jgi:hypothetical protein
MATVHYRVRFEVPPTLEAVRKKVHERTGLPVLLGKDAIDPGHEMPDIGTVREAGSLECDEAGDSDLDITVGQRGVRVDVMPGTNLYFRDAVLAALQDLGGHPDHKPGPIAAKKWEQLKEAERIEMVH